jgi:hypothetical protein
MTLECQNLVEKSIFASVIMIVTKAQKQLGKLDCFEEYIIKHVLRKRDNPYFLAVERASGSASDIPFRMAS